MKVSFIFKNVCKENYCKGILYIKLGTFPGQNGITWTLKWSHMWLWCFILRCRHPWESAEARPLCVFIIKKKLEVNVDAFFNHIFYLFFWQFHFYLCNFKFFFVILALHAMTTKELFLAKGIIFFIENLHFLYFNCKL